MSRPRTVLIDETATPLGLSTINAKKVLQVDVVNSVGSSGLTDAQLRASPVPVSGSFYQATQPVSIAAMPSTPVTFPTATSASCSNVASSASNVTLLNANSSRKMATFYNDSTSACYLKFGATASTSSFTIKIAAAGYFEMPLPIYTGQIDCIWDSANGSMRVTEY